MNLFLLFGVFSAVWFLCVALALRQRWFSRFKSGFLLVLLVTMISTGVGGTALIAMWNYREATNILTQQTASELQNIGRLIEQQIQDAGGRASDELNDSANTLYPEVAGNDAKGAEELLAVMVKTIPLVLQTDLFGVDGRALSSNRAAAENERVKVAVAFALEGKQFRWGPYFSNVYNKNIVLLAAPIQSPQKKIAALVVRYDFQRSLTELFAGVTFGQSGTALIANVDGRIVAHSDPTRVGEDISSYPAVKLALSGQQGVVRAINKRGEQRLFFYRTLNNPGSLETQNLALLVELREDEAAAPAGRLLREFYFGGAIVLFGALALAVLTSRQIRRSLTELVDVVRRIKIGDLTARYAHPGADETGQLGAALNDMAAGLQERDRIKELFGRYVTTQVSEQVLKGQVNLGGELRRVTMLFSDIRDFTPLSEQMEPQQVVTFLNNYFSEMVEAVFQYGGVLDKFMGDGMMAVFGSFGDVPDHPRRAVMAALRMKALLAKINGERNVDGKDPIRIGIGIHTDDVIVGNIGSTRRLEYTVIGDGVNTTSRVESLNKDFGTTVLITQSTHEQVQDAFECRLMPETKLKGKSGSIRFYEVLSAKAGKP